MKIFPCAGCAAKDQELTFLRGQVAELQKTLAEIADNGVNARLAFAAGGPQAAVAEIRKRKRRHWSEHEDKPKADLVVAETNEEIHRAFEEPQSEEESAS